MIFSPSWFIGTVHNVHPHWVQNFLCFSAPLVVLVIIQVPIDSSPFDLNRSWLRRNLLHFGPGYWRVHPRRESIDTYKLVWGT